ncbi:MFS family permease [Rhodanobacter sp. A1T4]|jgi:MFS family permease|nr:MFS family permease [Rhodanobacter sp. A1T4]
MRVLGAVLTAHYLAAFTALGMPVFMPSVLAQLAPGTPDWLAGTLYVLPTICTALTATGWGRLADRYGRKLSLMRAQVGLAFGFMLAGCAPNLMVFVVALIIQGSCGGSLAAANAYLSTQSKGPALARALDWTQFSARLAMLTAPILLGVAIDRGLAQSLYGYLSLLPLLGLVITSRLPPDTVETHTQHSPGRSMAQSANSIHRELWGLLTVQFLYYFAVVVTFPYFILYCRNLGITSDSMAGLIYSLPHLVYLLILPWQRSNSLMPQRLLLLGLGLLACTSLMQAMLTHTALLAPVRVFYGVGMTLAICGLNRALSHCAANAPAGRLFGLFDSCGKWAGALGGIVAGALVHRYGLAMPFFAAALAGAIALTAATLVFYSGKQRQPYVAAGDA